MGFDAIIRSGIATLNNATKSLQQRQQVRVFRPTTDVVGDETLGTGTLYDALVEMNPKASYRRSGIELPVLATVLILQPVSPALAPTDKVQLADGRTCPIVDLPGLLDPTSGAPYFAEVRLGQV